MSSHLPASILARLLTLAKTHATLTTARTNPNDFLCAQR